MNKYLQIILCLGLTGLPVFASNSLPSQISVTSVKVSAQAAEITVNNALTIREIKVLTGGGRTLLKFPESISKRGKVFPQVRLTSKQARDAVYSALEKRSSSSHWDPLKFEVTKVTRYAKKSSLKAFVLVVFGGGLEVECRVISGKSGIFVSWPARNDGNGWVDQVIIDDSKLKDEVESAVIAAYEK